MNSYRLGEVLEITSSKRIHAEDYVEKGIPFYRSKEAIQLSKGENITEVLHISLEQYNKIKAKFPVPAKGDILLTSVGTIGIPYYVTDPNFYFKDGNLTWFRKFSERINSKYLLLWMQSPFFKKQINNNNIGAVQKALTIDFLKTFRISLPSLEEQQKVVSVISSLDYKITTNNQINAELEAMAKTLYNYWFVQFDFPDKNGKPYKSSGGKMIWNEELKREIPEGWEVGTLDDIAELIRGVTYNGGDIKTSKDKHVIPILRATNITGNVLDLDDMVYVPDFFVSSKQLLQKHDILITMSSGSIDHIGKNGFFFYDNPVSFGAFCAKLSSKNNFTYFLYSFMQSKQFSSIIKNVCLGTNINNLNASLIKDIKTVLPPPSLVTKFNKILSPSFAAVGKNHRENNSLTSLRDWLLPMLMNGQVKVN